MTEDYTKQNMAHQIVKQAIEDGQLIRPSACELCKFEPENDFIMAHHWQSYDIPLVVWWICRSCKSAWWHDPGGDHQ